MTASDIRPLADLQALVYAGPGLGVRLSQLTGLNLVKVYDHLTTWKTPDPSWPIGYNYQTRLIFFVVCDPSGGPHLHVSGFDQLPDDIHPGTFDRRNKWTPMSTRAILGIMVALVCGPVSIFGMVASWGHPGLLVDPFWSMGVMSILMAVETLVLVILGVYYDHR